MTRGTYVGLLWLEALLCFGPITLVLLLGGVMVPIWVGMVVADVSGQLDFAEASGGQTVWLAIWPVVFVVGGLIGIGGLLRVLIILSRGQTSSSGRKLTLAMVAVGLIDLLSFNLYPTLLSGELERPAMDAPLLAYSVLPLGAALHFLYLSRRGLLLAVED